VRRDGLALDTGFLVHNVRNYPLLTRLFRELGVATQESEMSFSVTCPCGLEYSGRRPFAQPGRVADRAFHRLLWEIGRWLRTARHSLEELDCERWTLERYLDERRYSAAFRRHFLVPLTAALWSTAPGRALEYPAATAIRFFDNHGMLGLRRFRWRTVTGGADTYVAELARRLGPRLRVGLGVRSLRRDPDAVEIRTADDERRRFDAVVVATHADQALRLLEDAAPGQRRVLGAFGYSRNETVLHTDASVLPRAKGARASWNYLLPTCEPVPGAVRVSYDMNLLQGLDAPEPHVVTLNGDARIRPERVLARTVYEHPIYTPAALRAQRELPSLNDGVTAFAGAYHGWGFHEDGCRSGVEAAASLGVPW
jgi:predicted NAD/FAD-binding protein